MNFADLPLNALVQALSLTPAFVFECALFAPLASASPRPSIAERLQAVRTAAAKAPVNTRIAFTDGELHDAASLVRQRYASRGYLTDAAEALPAIDEKWRHGYFTLTAHADEALVGTVTLGFDAGKGLFADEGNAEEVGALRSRGRRLCEIVRLAVVEGTESKRTLAALFNAAYGLGRAHEVTDLIIEVNPRHVGFYCRSLGFKVQGKERICKRVGAPSVLLRLDVEDVSRRIEYLQNTVTDIPL